MKTFETVVPLFPGFYNSVLDSMLENDLESYLEENDLKYEDIESKLNFKEAALAMSQAWLKIFNEYCPFSLKFQDINSPKFYNFTTDRLIALISLKDLRRLVKYVKPHEDILEGVIKKHFTSRDGFMSFYSNSLEEWKTKKVQDLDLNEIMTYLEAAFLINLEEKGVTMDSFLQDIWDAVSEETYIYFPKE